MRVGDSPDTLEAAYTLYGPIPAGNWHLVGDGILTGSGVTNITVSFEVRLRPQAAVADELDTVLLSTQNTFQRDPDPQRAFAPVLFEATVPGRGADAAPGDRLIWRIHALRGDSGAMYIPNGDGDRRGQYPGARIPRLDLP
ncbi:MAG TPA: hypothetical protein PL196_10000 [Burkholderiaceae bacterium]|nr:hypothetical protein [Burkholderiaceae bacterium]